MNKVFLIGRMVKEAELSGSGGKQFASFSLAVRRTEEKTDFIQCKAFGKTAELMGNYGSKGRLISIIGSLRQNVWEDNNNVKHTNYDIAVSEVQFLQVQDDDKRASSKSQGARKSRQLQTVDVADDDIPF